MLSPILALCTALAVSLAFEAGEGARARPVSLRPGRLAVRLASYAPKLVNAVNASPLAGLAKKVLGVAHQRHLPKFAEQTLPPWLRGQPAPAAGSRRAAVPFADPWHNYFTPPTSRAARTMPAESGG